MKEGTIIHCSFVVDEDIYFGFQRAFKDLNPYHIDDEKAKEKGFKGKIMYGNILGGYLSYFVGMLLPSREVVIVAQSINFHLPFYLNDHLKFEAKLIQFSEAMNVGTLKFHFFRTEEKVAEGKIQVKFI